jgi:FixJ family two-component response regulator
MKEPANPGLRAENNDKWVFIVDDDPLIRISLQRLLGLAGYQCRTFADAPSYLAAPLAPFDAACLVLDIRMPEMTGTELQERLPGTDHDVPIVFITAYGDIPTCVQTLKAGAVDFIIKPFSSSELLAAVEEALRKSAHLDRERKIRKSAQDGFKLLSPRERQVMELVVRGLLNKQIAFELGIAEPTVKIHRSRIMAKMGAQSIAALVHLATYLDPGDPGARGGSAKKRVSSLSELDKTSKQAY